MISEQDLYSLHQVSVQISIRGLLARPPDSISVRHLLAISLFEISVQALSIRALLARSM